MRRRLSPGAVLALLALSSAFVVAAGICVPTEALAKANGIATTGCTGCHGGGATPTATVSVSNQNPSPGASLTVTVTINAVNGGPGGMYLRCNAGTFTLVSGQSTRLVSPTEVVHSAPKPQSGGKVTFQVTWTAPANKGGVDFDAWVLSANGNGASSGDGAGYARTSVAFGCAGTTYYRDFDLDGVGSAQSGTTVNCSVPAGYSAQNGDCDDNDETVFPGQAELCDGKDNDCNGMVDENLTPITFYPDMDGDGHGVPSSNTKTGCTPPPGYAPNKDDCNDSDPQQHPGATEICNFIDDNCDGTVDEGARVICGIGMCARYGLSCDPKLCTPGQPEAEKCNYLDDDCNGVIDDGATCPAGQACVEGSCVAASSVPDAGSGNGGGNGGDGSSSSTTSGGCSAAPSAVAIAALISAALFLFGRRRTREG